MPAGRYDITIEAGSTFQLRVTWKDSNGTPINLTGYTARMKVKPTYGGVATFSLTSPSGGLVLGGAAGTIDVTISATDTATNIGDTESTAMYDLEVESSGGVVTRLVQGKAFLKPEVTD
jgi:hypothetical protein